MTVAIWRNIVPKDGKVIDKPTKNRRRRVVTVDTRCLEFLRMQVDANVDRAGVAGIRVVDDPYLLTTSLDGSEPWHPDTITQYFSRLRERLELGHLEFRGLRRFMDTYGQELGFSLAQVSLRAGHDPAVASKHYTGRVTETDRQIAAAISQLLGETDKSE